MTVTADDLDAAMSAVTTALAPALDRDWTAVPGTGTWTGWQTAEHLGDCLLSYAAQLAVQPATRYVRFLAAADEGASAAEVLEFAVAGSVLLGAAVRTAPPEASAYHPTGMADPEGFAGMGCVETLIHGHDIAHSFGLGVDPPREVCARVVSRMFPEVEPLADPWETLQWATNRISVPGRPSRENWRWRGAPN